VLLIAHRGASGHAPENTMAAFKLALQMGAKAVEFDVHQTRDGELVVIHDDDLRRVSKKKLSIRQLRLSELQAFEVGAWFSRDFRTEKIPTLAEVYDLMHGQAEFHLEIKHGSAVYPGIERNVVEFLRRRHALKDTLISSFDHAALANVRDLEEGARLGYLLGLELMPKAWKQMKTLGVESLNCSWRQVRADRVAFAHRQGLKVLVYTVNDQKQADRLGKMGIDGIFSNFPELKA
jgi:glycerophosphoryl diester phosphodiesterase